MRLESHIGGEKDDTLMSIIIALVSTRGAVVASDGRRFSPAYPDRGIPAEVELDNFDKTFSLLDGKVIGANAGLMAFSEQSVGEHISETVSTWSNSSDDFESLATTIKHDIQEKLASIKNDEVGFEHRQLDLLLVARDQLAGSVPKIISMSFRPQNEMIAAGPIEIVEANLDRPCYYIHGDFGASAGAERVLRENRAPNQDAKFLKKFAHKAIATGICSASTHPYGNEPSCGGRIFVKQLSKQPS